MKYKVLWQRHLDLLAQLVDGDLLVFDDAHHLKLVDAIADGNKFGWNKNPMFKERH